jgi:hypothetical protein
MPSIRFLSPWWIVACTVLGLGLAGCGEKRDAATVSGTVKVAGKPLEGIRVSFEPIGRGLGQGSAGVTDASGKYTLKFVDNDRPGALVGKHRVTFFDMKSTPPGESPDAGNLPPVKSRLPAKYLTETLEYEVKEGDNQADFDLN